MSEKTADARWALGQVVYLEKVLHKDLFSI